MAWQRLETSWKLTETGMGEWVDECVNMAHLCAALLMGPVVGSCFPVLTRITKKAAATMAFVNLEPQKTGRVIKLLVDLENRKLQFSKLLF